MGEHFIGKFQLISTEGFGEERITVKVPGSDCYKEVQWLVLEKTVYLQNFKVFLSR